MMIYLMQFASLVTTVASNAQEPLLAASVMLLT